MNALDGELKVSKQAGAEAKEQVESTEKISTEHSTRLLIDGLQLCASDGYHLMARHVLGDA